MLSLLYYDLGECIVLNFGFIINSVVLGVGLGMDAFSVSLANGMNEPTMKRGKCSSSQECLADFRG